MAKGKAYSPSSERDLLPEFQRKKRRVHFFNLRYWLRDLLLSICIALTIIFFLYQPVQVEGISMAPQLVTHQRLLINRFLYKFKPVNQGDIVVFRFPNDMSRSYIKRIIGLPGDQVEIQDGKVVVNGKILNEPYLPLGHLDQRSYSMIKIPPDHYYVLGDHRDSSYDSRHRGVINQKTIYGKAVFCYWPFDLFGVVN